MILSVKPYLLEFKHPFGVSSNKRTHTPTVFLRLELDGKFGYGEACLPKYLGEDTDDTVSFLEKTRAILNGTKFPFSIQEIMKRVDTLSEKNNAGKAAIDIALWDLQGKFLSKTVHEMMGLQFPQLCFTSSTIGIDDDSKLKMKIEEAKDFKILKIKAGTEDDKALINKIRVLTNKPLYVDVNQGWKDTGYVIEMLHWMKEQNVLLVEQPMPVEMLKEMRLVTEKSPIPTIADESVKRLIDIEKIEGYFSGINIKLMKSCGLSEGFEMIKLARKKNLKVMLGCMAESSCATTAMAQLTGMADFIDLDAPNLIVNDPFFGIKYEGGSIVLNEKSGIGSLPLDQFFDQK